jgi:hypothetical protein
MAAVVAPPMAVVAALLTGIVKLNALDKGPPRSIETGLLLF